jgi:hypothetical protein
MSGDSTTTTNQSQWNNQHSNSSGNTNTSAYQSYSPQVIGEGQSVFGNASNVGGFTPYSGSTQGSFGSEWGTAGNALEGALGQNNQNTVAGANTLQQVIGNIGGNTTSQYMNPYVSATLAPTIQSINDSAALQHQQNGANATMAGAYGGTAQGVADALTNRYQQQNIGNATGQAYDNAYQSAVNSQQQGNAALTSAAGGLNTIGAGQAGQQNTLASLLANMGSTEQTANQGGINNAESQNLTNNTQPLNNQATLAQILATIPKDTTSGSNIDTSSQGVTWGHNTGTTQQIQPNNTGMALLGKILGGI